MTSAQEPLQIMSGSEIDRTVVRLAHEILEKTTDLGKLAFIGVRRRGLPIAQRLAAKIREIEGLLVPVGELDIRLYRDDLTQLGQQAVLNNTDIPFPVEGRDLLIVDDVLYTGRTVRAAMDALFELGRPARVQLLALIDRGHRELPIEARYVGRQVTTTPSQIVEVHLREIDQGDRVILVHRKDGI